MKDRILNIISIIIQVILAVLAVVITWMVFAGAFATNLCNEISTCYTIVIFLLGIIITLKLKLLDEKNNKVELVLFIVGILANIVFLAIAYVYDCASVKIDFETNEKIIDLDNVKSALLLLNATIWVDFIILMRNIYLVIIGYFKIKSDYNNKNDSPYLETRKDSGKDKSNYWICFFIIIVVFCFAITSFFIRKNYSDNIDKRNDFDISVFAACVSGFCAILGGLFTLFGVKRTIRFEKQRDKEKSIKDNKPEINIPFKYDIADTVQIPINKDGIKLPILNKKIVLRNSSKKSFIIIEFYVNDECYNNSLNVSVEPNILFCLAFNNKEEVKKVRMILSSEDDLRYECVINLKEENAHHVEVKNVSN